MTTASGSRTTKHALVRRVDVRRHALMACMASIVLALHPLTSFQVERLTVSPIDGPAAAMAIELTGQLCLAHDSCGSITARLVKR